MVSNTLDNDKGECLPKYLCDPGVGPLECPLGSPCTLTGQMSTCANQIPRNCIHTLCDELWEVHQWQQHENQPYHQVECVHRACSKQRELAYAQGWLATQ